MECTCLRVNGEKYKSFDSSTTPCIGKVIFKSRSFGHWTYHYTRKYSHCRRQFCTWATYCYKHIQFQRMSDISANPLTKKEQEQHKYPPHITIIFNNIMQRCEIVSEIRKLQATLVDKHTATTLRDISARRLLVYHGSICPPQADFAHPFERVHVLLLWHMTVTPCFRDKTFHGHARTLR